MKKIHSNISLVLSILGVVACVFISTPAFSTVPYMRGFIWDNTNGMRNLNDLIPKNCAWVISAPRDINDKGHISGHGYINGDYRYFLLTLKNKNFYEVTDLGMNWAGDSLNNRGDIAGAAFFEELGEWHAAIRRADGEIIDLGGCSDGRAAGLNDQGQAVGFSCGHLFVWDETNGMTELLTPGAIFPYARDINNYGNCSGRFTTQAVERG